MPKAYYKIRKPILRKYPREIPVKEKPLNTKARILRITLIVLAVIFVLFLAALSALLSIFPNHKL